jgi:hypothetical protein
LRLANFFFEGHDHRGIPYGIDFFYIIREQVPSTKNYKRSKGVEVREEGQIHFQRREKVD